MPLMWLWLLLVSIAAHAMLPVGSPMVRSKGSAFSATTFEVAITPKRKARTNREALVEANRHDDKILRAGTGGDSGFVLPSEIHAPAPLSQTLGHELPSARPVPGTPPARNFRARAPPSA